MPRAGSVVALAAVCGWMAHPPVAGAAERPADGLVLQVAWVDPTGCACGLESIALPEVARLLREMGVHVTWRRDRGLARAVSDEVRVVVLDRARLESEGLVLGASLVPRPVGSVAWVHLPSVRRALGMHPAWSPWRLDHGERRTVGIALGRVAAHEIVHAVAPDVPHGGGLMAERFSRDLLTGPALRLDREVALAVRRALAAGPGLEPALANLEAGKVAVLALGPQ